MLPWNESAACCPLRDLSVRMVLLELGIDRLGALAIVSVPCTVSQGTGRDFANLTLIVYHIPVAAQFVIKGPGG